MELPFRNAPVPFMRPLLISISVFLLLGALSVSAEPVQAKHARLELISQSPGTDGQLWLGVHFALEKDWHIYWVNPGDSGQPPVLKWQLPPGFGAGEIQWPLPEKLKRATLADYGYQDDVVLLVPIRVPRDWKAGSNTDLGLQAKWLICREICIADHADLHLALVAAANESQSATIDQARKL